MILYGGLAFVFVSTGAYQFKFKITDETTLKGFLIRAGAGM